MELLVLRLFILETKYSYSFSRNVIFDEMSVTEKRLKYHEIELNQQIADYIMKQQRFSTFQQKRY